MPRFSSSADFHQTSFRIKHEDGSKLFNKLLSRESSKSYPSFRVYYGDVSGSVPFGWETCPGTPKHSSFCDRSHVPPLTPPPSYHADASTKRSTGRSRPKMLLHTLLRRISIPKIRYRFSPPRSSLSLSLSSPSSSSSRSSFSDVAATPRRQNRFSSWDSARFCDDGAAERRREKCDVIGSKKSCFSPGGYPALIVKKALLPFVGRGSRA